MKQPFFLLLLALAGLVLGISPVQAGYTHYFTWKQKPDRERLRAGLREMRLVTEAAKELLAGEDGTGKPRIEPFELELNGVGEEAHEPFVFPGEQGFNFCKTAAKPYDAVVTACLLVARDHFSSEVLDIASDGNWDQGDWGDGARLYEKVLGRRASNPMGARGAGRDRPGQLGSNALSKGVLLALGLLVLWFGARIFIRRRESHTGVR